MLKKILLGTAIAAVLSTVGYAQNQPSPPAFFQNWFTDAQSAYNQVKDAVCYDGDVASAVSFMNTRDSSMVDWVVMAIDVGIEPSGDSDIHPSQARLNAIAAELPLAESELNQVTGWINALKAKPPCVEEKKPVVRKPVALTPEQADQALRVLLGLPSRDAERTAGELDKTLKDDPKAGKDLLNDDSKKAEQQSPKTSTQTEPQTPAKTDTKTETNPEHSTRSVTPEKVDAPKQVARTTPVEHAPEVRNIEAHQTISHVTSNIGSAHMNSIGNLGAMHEVSAMHMGGMGSMGGLGGMLHMGGLGGLGGMHMGGMHFGRM
jgi:hypothetical protein